MSSEAGGRADKLGNEYERLWVVWHLIELIAERATSVLIEPPGEDERGTEFWVGRSDGTREAHQCKRENGTIGYWSAASLESKRVLSNAIYQLRRDPSHTFLFVSGDKVRHVSDLAERARAYGDAKVFRREAVDSSVGHRSEFQNACRHLKLNPDDPSDLAIAFDFLRRFRCVIKDKEAMRDDVETSAMYWIDGQPTEAVAALKDLADASIGRILRLDDVIAHLSSHGLRPRNLVADPRLRPAMDELRARFDRSYRHLLIDGKPLDRQETGELFALLTGEAGPNVILAHGAGGDGKSGVAFEVTLRLAAAGVASLPLRLDRDPPPSSPLRYGQSLDLPTSPVACLAAEADGRLGVLLLDQVDAIRWTAAHSAHAWDTVERLVVEVLRHPNLRVVVVCRTFDIEDDRRIKAWKERQNAVAFHIGPLNDGTVDRVVDRAGMPASSLTPEQRRVLRSPQGLYLWRILHRPGAPLKPFRTMTELMRRFWEEVRAGRVGSNLPAGWEDSLLAIVAYMDDHGTLAAPATFRSRWPMQIKGLLSANILVEGTREELLFAHQSYVDYLAAERVLLEIHRGAGCVTDWLRKHDQSLFRRGQLRQLLTLLRDDDPLKYADALRSILSASDVRFHLRHLALQLLGQADPPIASEIGLVLKLADDENWLSHLSSHVVVGRPAWFDALNERDVLREWLKGTDEKRRNLALTILERALEARASAVGTLLLDTGRPAKRNRLEAVLWRTPPERLSKRLFRAFLWLAKRGSRVVGFVDWKRLAAASPGRFILLLDACLLRDGRTRRIAAEGSEAKWLDRSALITGDTLKVAVAAATRFPARAWDRLVPHLVFATREGQLLRRRRNVDDFHRSYDRREYLRRIRRVLHTLLSAAGKVLVATEPESFWKRVQDLADVRSASITRLLASCMVAGPDRCADTTLSWLLASQSRLSCGSGERGSRYRPARRLIRRYAAPCSSALLIALQESIMAMRPVQERWSFDYRHHQFIAVLRGSKVSGFDILTYNHAGLGRYLLLSAMALNLAPDARDYLGTLRRKFGPPAPLLRKQRRSLGGFVGSVIPQERLHLLSDRDWLRIVRGKWPTSSTKWKAMGRGTIGEASSRTFSGALGQTAHRQPRRFVRLMLRMPTNCDPAYPAAILRAIVDGNPTGNAKDMEIRIPPSASEIEAAIAHFESSLVNQEFATAVCWAIERQTDEKWSMGMLGRLARLATDHEDPQPGELSVSSGERTESTGAAGTFDVVASARNCVRGAAAYAIEAVLFSQPEATDVLWPTLERLLGDSHPAVRVAALGPTLPLLNIDRTKALDVFLLACGHPDDRILRAHDVARFLGYTILENLHRLRPLLDRMITCSVEPVVQVAASFVAQVWAYDGRLTDLAEACQRGVEPQRLGFAEGLALSITDGRTAEDVVAALIRLFHDESENVRNAAASVFRDHGALGRVTGAKLAEALAQSPALDGSADNLLWALDAYTGSLLPFAGAITTIVAHFVSVLPAESGATHRRSWDGGTLAKLLLRLYEQADHDPDLRRQCLDAWDNLLEDGLWFDVLKHIDGVTAWG
jgi:hypothetical protein